MTLSQAQLHYTLIVVSDYILIYNGFWFSFHSVCIGISVWSVHLCNSRSLLDWKTGLNSVSIVSVRLQLVVELIDYTVDAVRQLLVIFECCACGKR